MVTINGNALPVAGQTLSEYLAATDFDPKRIAGVVAKAVIKAARDSGVARI